MSTYDSRPTAQVTADLGQGQATQQVTAWSVSRSLSGAGLPGQTRAAAGSSVASGSCSVEAPGTPWSAGVRPGGLVTITAADDAGGAMSPLGTLRVRSISAPGALSTQRDLDLEDDITAALAGAVTLPTTLAASSLIDASWVIDQVARAAGYYATPVPRTATGGTPVVCAPLAGSLDPEVGTWGQYVDPTASSWGTGPDGQIRLYTPQVMYTASSMTALGATIAADVVGVNGATATLSAVVGDAPNGVPAGAYTVLEIELSWPSGTPSWRARTRTASRTGTWSTLNTRTYGTGTADLPYRAVFTLRKSGSSFTVAEQGPPGRPEGAFVTLTYTPDASQVIEMFGGFGASSTSTSVAVGALSAWPVTTLLFSTVLWDAPTARIAATGSPLTALVGVGRQSGWALAQAVAAATLGAVWVDEAGMLRYRDAMALRAGASTETIVGALHLDDVPWSITSDDVADRVELTYQPPDLQTSQTAAITIWQATDAIKVGPRSSTTVYVDLDGGVPPNATAAWMALWDTTAPAGSMSRWAAATSRDGGGTQPAVNALQITSTLVNPSRIKLTITNTTASTLYTVDGTGSPMLILRAFVYATAGEAVTISSGVSADESVSTLTYDCGTWVQDPTFAARVLDWLTSQTAVPQVTLPALGVTPRAARRMGDIITISDTTTGLRSRAIIAGTTTSGSAGQTTQQLTLTLLDPVEGDVALYVRGALGSSATEADLATYLTTNLGASASEQTAGQWLAGRTV